MPELPEVETTKRKLKPLIKGKRILNFNRKILNIERKGKAILIYLSGGKILGFHQRMSGKILVVPHGWKDKHTHHIFHLSGGKDLVMHDVRKFGVVWYGSAKKVLADNYFKTLGPDALSISFKDFKTILKPPPSPLLRKEGGKIKIIPSLLRRGKGRDRGLMGGSKTKTFLLNQKNLAGIGNIMADEILWRAKINPETAVSDLSDDKIVIFWRSLRAVLKRSIKMGGSTMRDWLHPGGERGGYFEERYVYDREGKKCSRCRAKILRKKIAGRSSYFCLKCQPRRV